MDARLTFGEWLEDQYLRRGFTQQEFAERVGVGQSTVSSWVNGQKRPRRRIVPAIAAALEVDETEVLERAGIVRSAADSTAAAVRRDTQSYDPSPLDDPELTLWASYLGELDPHDKRILEELARTMLRNKREG